jgi:hypothetical protein
MILVGCRPELPLLAALAAVHQTTKAGLRRRHVSADVGAVAADGSAASLVGGIVSGTVLSSVPSALDPDLLDVTIAADEHEPRPAGARGIVDLWFTGRPAERNLWARYDRTLRHEWAGVALAHHRRDIPDRQAGTVFHLDGRHVTDIEGFYCATGMRRRSLSTLSWRCSPRTASKSNYAERAARLPSGRGLSASRVRGPRGSGCSPGRARCSRRRAGWGP